MRNKVYGIFSGCYSDWSVSGYFTNLDEAEKYCAFMNEKLDDYDEYYVRVLESMDGDVDVTKIILAYEHEVVFDLKEDKYIMRDEPTRYDYYTGVKRKNSIRYGNRYGWISFKINLDNNDRKLAEKIAQDTLNIYKVSLNECGDKTMAIKSLGWKVDII